MFGGAGSKGMVRALKEGSDSRLQADVSYSPKFIHDAIKLTAEARLARGLGSVRLGGQRVGSLRALTRPELAGLHRLVERSGRA